MKVSISIKLTKNDEGYSWNSALKFKANIKPLSGIIIFYSAHEAMLHAINTSLDAVKTPCTIDVFCNNLGSIEKINNLLHETSAIKSKYQKHTLKFYAS